jgi:probable rRNA maturation factor
MPMKNTKKTSNLSPAPAEVSHREVKLKLATQYAARAVEVPPRSAFRKWIKAALTHDAEIGLRVVDEAEGHSLNRNFRDRDYATNVLTFIYDNAGPSAQSLAGDIVLCAPVIEREAREQHKNLTAHYAHLTVHGVLHLQGYDHESDVEAATMEQMEAEIVERLGYENPYRESSGILEES